MVSKSNICLFASGFLGIAFLVTGGVLLYEFPIIINNEIDNQIVLKNGSDAFDMWKEVKVPIYFQVWMFDIVNHMDVLRGEKPAVVQRGPYTYREKRKKVNIKFSENGSTVSYRELRTFFFDRKRSVGPESDTFYTLNLPMITIMDLVRNEYAFIKDLVKAAFSMSKEKYFVNLTVADLMWGYEDPLFATFHKVVEILHLNISVPDKFGLFYGQNGTDDGLYEIYTGLGDVTNFAEIITWNGMKNLKFWTSDLANSINGSDGTLYPPHIDEGKTKYLFSSDICRSLGMDFTEAITTMGIDMKRFVAPEFLFGNATVNPYNAGFCTPAGDCLPSGLLNVSVCRDGAPVVMSMPHFLGCDPYIVDSIDGLHPNQKEHQSLIDIEPMTGVVMNADKRLQINVYIDEVDGFPDTKNLKPTYMPLMWLNESALIDKKDADDFKSKVYGNIKLTEAVKYGLMALGGFVLFLVIIIVARRVYLRRTQESKAIIINTSSDDDPLLIPNGNTHA